MAFTYDLYNTLCHSALDDITKMFQIFLERNLQFYNLKILIIKLKYAKMTCLRLFEKTVFLYCYCFLSQLYTDYRVQH